MGRSRGLRPAGPGGRRGRPRRRPRASPTQARPPCSWANLATSESPIPSRAHGVTPSDPDGTARRSPRGSRPERPDRRPRPRSRRRRRARRHLQPDPPVGGVCRAAFMSRFSTIRSTFAGSTAITTASASATTSRPRQDVEALDGPPREGAHVGHAVLRLHDAPVEPVDVQQILQQPVELRCVLRQSPEQIPRSASGISGVRSRVRDSPGWR